MSPSRNKIVGYPGETIEHFACRLVALSIGNNQTWRGEFNNVKLTCKFPDTVDGIIKRYKDHQGHAG